MLISRTPYRLSLFGGGLDYPSWYSHSPSRVLCAGLDYYCYITLRKLPPFFSHKYRIAYSRIESCNSIDDIIHPSAREAFRAFGSDFPLELSHVGDLPARSGIGSSSAFTVGLINALTGLRGRYLGRSALASAAIDLEQNAMGEKVGFQDQCAAAFGGLVLIDADSSGIRPRKFITSSDYLNYITSNLLLGFDGIERFSTIASSKVVSSIESSNKVSLLNELFSISCDAIDLFGKQADISTLSHYTKLSREIKHELNGDTSNSRLHQIISATESAGSLCTRGIGAGGGGFFLCWAPSYRHEEIKASVKVNTWVDVRISDSGSQIIFSQ